MHLDLLPEFLPHHIAQNLVGVAHKIVILKFHPRALIILVHLFHQVLQKLPVDFPIINFHHFIRLFLELVVSVGLPVLLFAVALQQSGGVLRIRAGLLPPLVKEEVLRLFGLADSVIPSGVQVFLQQRAPQLVVLNRLVP